MVKIAVDAMGGDFAPEEIIKGAELVINERKELSVYLVGKKENIKEALRDSSGKIKIVEASEIIEMDESPVTAVREKLNSSIVKGIEMVKKGEVDSFVSAGNTGAVMAASTLYLKRIEGVLRPAIGVMIPTNKNPVLLIDAGANADCKPENLIQFASMGTIFMKSVFKMPTPTIGLVSIGEEETKGSELVKQAHVLIKNSNLNFKGNIEASEIFKGDVDVVVCDGFTGNIILKEAEGLADVIFKEMKEELSKSVLSKIGGALVKKSLKNLVMKLNYEEYGGAQLLGINGTVTISHGKSKSRAIKNAILSSYKSVNAKIVENISLNKLGI